MSALSQLDQQFISGGPRRTEALGAALGCCLEPGDVVCVSGQLGAGKTVFSRGIGIGWGATPPLTSPTYNLAHEHGRARDDRRLFHLDLYRISGAREAESLGLDDILADDRIVIMEWPERILESLPAERLWIDIEIAGGRVRTLRFEARGESAMVLLDRFLRQVPETITKDRESPRAARP